VNSDLIVLSSRQRRGLLFALGASLFTSGASRVAPVAATPAWDGPVLDTVHSRQLRAWMVRLISAQIRNGPTPRWSQRDCAGLVRFAVAESLREHDVAWKRANGLLNLPMPPALELDASARNALRHRWRLADGTNGAYASAIDIVQGNCTFVSKDWQRAQPADLFFFDHGDDQHLMIWMGQQLAYHTGSVTAQDNGLRAVNISNLMQWRDTRWQPHKDNSNFAGIYRLAFLAR
jgi:uncharacterized protein